jgi:hypothetical protein
VAVSAGLDTEWAATLRFTWDGANPGDLPPSWRAAISAVNGEFAHHGNAAPDEASIRPASACAAGFADSVVTSAREFAHHGKAARDETSPRPASACAAGFADSVVTSAREFAHHGKAAPDEASIRPASACAAGFADSRVTAAREFAHHGPYDVASSEAAAQPLARRALVPRTIRLVFRFMMTPLKTPGVRSDMVGELHRSGDIAVRLPGTRVADPALKDMVAASAEYRGGPLNT